MKGFDKSDIHHFVDLRVSGLQLFSGTEKNCGTAIVLFHGDRQ